MNSSTEITGEIGISVVNQVYQWLTSNLGAKNEAVIQHVKWVYISRVKRNTHNWYQLP